MRKSAVKNLAKIALTSGALAFLVACAGVNFTRPASESTVNGRTTRDQVIEKMGPPWKEGSLLKNEKMIQTITYARSTAGGTSLHSGVTPARAMGFYFLNNTLVGYEFLSSYAEDNSNFDESKIPSIIKGKTTKEEVLNLMGKPGGYYIYPMINTPTGEAAIYQFQETTGSAFNLKFFHKTLTVTFNTDNIVSSVDYITSGEANK